MNPSVTIDSASSLPPFEQVRSQLAAAMSAGNLVAGTRLPSVRAMAADLGLAVNTVARAYRELELAGLVETLGRGGTVVTAAGVASRRRARDAASAYATLTRTVGIDADEALAIVAAALDHGT